MSLFYYKKKKRERGQSCAATFKVYTTTWKLNHPAALFTFPHQLLKIMATQSVRSWWSIRLENATQRWVHWRITPRALNKYSQEWCDVVWCVGPLCQVSSIWDRIRRQIIKGLVLWGCFHSVLQPSDSLCRWACSSQSFLLVLSSKYDLSACS